MTPHELRRRLRRTWPAFFAQFGNLTEVQRRAMPSILAGRSTLVIAATATGKTEAAVSPLLERHLDQAFTGSIAPSGLRILYICPTRALTRDLFERLSAPLAQLGVTLDMKTSDAPAINLRSPPTLLITTPESTDSLLTRAPRLFVNLTAIVLDEVHLFDHTPRGDHLRCLLRRIEQIRDFHQRRAEPADTRPLQQVALSATVPDPEGVARRYLASSFETDQIVVVPGGRELDAVVEPLDDLGDLAVKLTARAGGANIRKSLIFCNTRNEVEQIAAYLRDHLPYAARVFVHYSNLDPEMRRDVEDDFAAASVALCVCTSTLELGIDIGSIDDVVLIGPPPTLASFLQRIGRGGRRTAATRVLCLFRSPLEELRFAALLGLAGADAASRKPPAYHFRPSVLVQQIFSRLKQSPTGAIRLADVQRIAPEPVDEEDLRDLFANLVSEGHLRTGRSGEWRPGPALDELLDAHDIYSNFGADALAITVVDAFSGRVIAQTDRVRLEGEMLLLGGRWMEVVWRDGRRFGVRASAGIAEWEKLHFAATPFALPLEISQGMARVLGLPEGSLSLLPEEEGAWLFHFWGETYGMLLAHMLQRQLYPEALLAGLSADEEIPSVRVHNAVCLYLPEVLLQLPAWSEAEALRELNHLLPRLQPFLDLGRFHSLLPARLAHDTAVAHCNLPRFEELYRSAKIVIPNSERQRRLGQLL